MRSALLLLICLVLPASASAGGQREPFKFEKVIDGATIVASGKTISLWGVKPIAATNPNSYAAKLYLETMLKTGALSCSDEGRAGGLPQMHCYIDSADVGSLMVQMGMAMAGDPYYDVEQSYAQAQQRGVWKSKNARGQSL
jgi:endonuclease YncB( thermonuclease family)